MTSIPIGNMDVWNINYSLIFLENSLEYAHNPNDTVALNVAIVRDNF